MEQALDPYPLPSSVHVSSSDTMNELRLERKLREQVELVDGSLLGFFWIGLDGLTITSSSPLSEYKAYLNQFQRYFTTFLRMRSEEMVCNGRMVLTLIGRDTLDGPLYRDCWTLLFNSLPDLLFEGLLSASKVNSFKMPFYDPSEEEVKEIIRKEGSFQITNLETHEFDLGHSNEDCSLPSHRAKSGQKETSCIRAVTETVLVVHFGDAIIDALFKKYTHHVSQHASCRVKTTVTLIVSLIRK